METSEQTPVVHRFELADNVTGFAVGASPRIEIGADGFSTTDEKLARRLAGYPELTHTTTAAKPRPKSKPRAKASATPKAPVAAAQGARLQRSVVRASPVQHSHVGGPKHVNVLASFVRLAGPASCDRDELVRVHAHCGYLGFDDDGDQKTYDRRDAILAAIAATCDRHQLELRAGAYELSRR